MTTSGRFPLGSCSGDTSCPSSTLCGRPRTSPEAIADVPSTFARTHSLAGRKIWRRRRMRGWPRLLVATRLGCRLTFDGRAFTDATPRTSAEKAGSRDARPRRCFLFRVSLTRALRWPRASYARTSVFGGTTTVTRMKPLVAMHTRRGRVHCRPAKVVAGGE